jgi:hypothetical protein
MSIVRRARIAALSALVALPLTTGAVVAQQATPQSAPKHHSKLKGAAVGAAAGHVMGHHAKAGAVAGAVVQHERNRKARKAKD